MGVAWTWPARHLNRGWLGLFQYAGLPRSLGQLHAVMPKPFCFPCLLFLTSGSESAWIKTIMMDLMNLLKVYTKAVFNPGQVLSFHCDVESWRGKKNKLDWWWPIHQAFCAWCPGPAPCVLACSETVCFSCGDVVVTRLGSPNFPANAPLLSSVSLLQYYDLISGRSMCLPPVCSVNEYVCQWIITGKSLSNRCWLSQLWRLYKNPSCSLPFLRLACYSC